MFRGAKNFPDGDNDKIRDSNLLGLGIATVPFRRLLATIRDEIGLQNGDVEPRTSVFSIRFQDR